MAKVKGEEFLKLTKMIANTAQATSEFLSDSCLVDLDEIFGNVLNKLNVFFKRVEESFRDFVIFERYVVCAYASELGYGLREIPPEIRKRVWDLRDNPEICGFTEKECKCKKSMDYLKQRFTDKVNVLSSSGEIIRTGSEELRSGMKALGSDVESLTVSAQKIMNIAELIEIIALNAYIEAARLGEQGRGFKVIADEVRRASMKTNELASEIVESIKALQTRFNQQIDRQAAFDRQVMDLEREQREFSRELNRDLLWMAQNFIDFLEYVRHSVEKDMSLLGEVRSTILSVLQTIDIANQRTRNTYKALLILARMMEEFERVLRGERDLEEGYREISRLYEEFRNIPKLLEEREVVAKAEGRKIDREQDTVGQKLEGAETDIELF